MIAAPAILAATAAVGLQPASNSPLAKEPEIPKAADDARAIQIPFDWLLVCSAELSVLAGTTGPVASLMGGDVFLEEFLPSTGATKHMGMTLRLGL